MQKIIFFLILQTSEWEQSNILLNIFPEFSIYGILSDLLPHVYKNISDYQNSNYSKSER